MIPRPPRSTHFPYTTLFRSSITGRSHATASTTGRPNPSVSEDRKSTRLNSSHDQISYAVFCLKKKNQENRLTGQSQRNIPVTERGSRIVMRQHHQRS